MFHKDFEVTTKKLQKLKKSPRGLRRNYNMFWTIRVEQQGEIQDLCKKEITHLRLEKDQNNKAIIKVMRGR
jgi:hypothetical protein